MKQNRGLSNAALFLMIAVIVGAFSYVAWKWEGTPSLKEKIVKECSASGKVITEECGKLLEEWRKKYPESSSAVNPAEEAKPENKIEGNKEDLVSFSVSPGDTISGIFNFSGTVKNAYFFEANIRVNILNADKKLLKAGHGTATNDWMTTGPVMFTGTIDLSGLPLGLGYIQIANDNASGLSAYDKFIFIPVIIGDKEGIQ